MSYQVLARKWRPSTFTEVIGQQHVLQALTNSLTMGRLHHAYLFSGTRGVGKTSIARLLAKGLNCETGITATPCGECATCLEIGQGRFIDLLEIDAASRTKVEDTRDLLDNVQYAPARGRFKIYLIDEVHMLSRHSFNALLKTLEEPPGHVKFLLATTDPQKLPVTILSRCLQFHLKVLESDLIRQQLEKVTAAENVPATTRALSLLARAAEGSMRDALSLTDQAIALGNGEIKEELVAQMLGVMTEDQPLLLLEVLVRGHGAEVMGQIDHIASLGVEWEQLLITLLALLHRIAIIQLLPAGSAEIAAQELQHEGRLRELARVITPTDLQCYYQIVLIGRKELAYAPDRRMGVEMTLLRALAFYPCSVQASPAVINPVSVADSDVSGNSGTMEHSATTENRAQLANSAAINAEQTTVAAAISPAIALAAEQRQEEGSAHAVTAAESLIEARKKIRQIQQQVQVKKTKPAAHTAGLLNSSAIQRQAGKKRTTVVSTTTATVPAEEQSDPETGLVYRWQARTPKTPADVSKTAQITADTVRTILEDEKTAKFAAELIKESIEQDSWSALVAQLKLPKLVEQLALNAFMQQGDQQQESEQSAEAPRQIRLHLRTFQRHLNKENNRVKLQEALTSVIGHTVTLSIIEDDSGQQRTPMEWRQALFAEKLAHARQSLSEDSQLQQLCELFDAELEEGSIRLL